MNEVRETTPVWAGSSSVMMCRMSKGVGSKPTSAKNALMASGVMFPVLSRSTWRHHTRMTEDDSNICFQLESPKQERER